MGANEKKKVALFVTIQVTSRYSLIKVPGYMIFFLEVAWISTAI